MPSPLPDWLDLERLAAVDVDDDRWRSRAACRGVNPAVFFDQADFSKPAAICAGCTVRHECLAWTLVHDPSGDGYVGDTTASERKTVRAALRGRPAARRGEQARARARDSRVARRSA
jgi:hypothetical protein